MTQPMRVKSEIRWLNSKALTEFLPYVIIFLEALRGFFKDQKTENLWA